MSTQWQKARETLKTQREAKVSKHRCECGCLQFTIIAKWSDAKRGYVRGKPMRFVRGHSHHRPVAPLEIHAVPAPAPFPSAFALICREERAKRDAAKESLIQAAAAQFQEAMDAMKAAHNPHRAKA